MKQTHLFFGLVLLSFSLVFTSCIQINNNKEKDKEEESTDNEEDEDNIVSINGDDVEVENLEDAVNAISDAFKGLNKDGATVETVDFRELKELLPERLLGYKRIDVEGERSGMGGFKISQAKAEYEDGDSDFDVTIVDGGGLAGLVNGMAAWSMLDVDKESDDGYERTLMIDGYKAYEKYNNKTKDGTIAIFVEDRFIVTIEGNEIKAKDLRKALDGIKIERLKKLI